MAKGPEKEKVNDPFRKGMVEAFPQIHWQRIENTTGVGVPDINFCLDGVEVWVEDKWTPSKKGARFSHPLTPSQCGWILKRVHSGGSAWVLARRVDTFRLWHGSWAKEIVDQGWNAPGSCITMGRPWAWVELIDTMLTEPCTKPVSILVPRTVRR